MDFLNDFGTLWAPFRLHFGVVLGTKFGKEKYRIFKSLPGAILGAPGSLQARKVWFYLRKTRVFEYQPFLPRATLGSILEPKMALKGAKIAPKWL